MPSGTAIRATGVGKRFASYHRRATSVKERVVARRGVDRSDFWALRGVDAEIQHGETVGLIGANGSGKSTLLKVLAGILRPTEGTVRTFGPIASLLELGAGFNGELSGRDNVYLNASLLGLTRRQTDAIFDELVEFSELGAFIDNQVKHYSSGMYVRLGFSVAIHVDPDILLVDEVLAVGDEAFQQKCLTRIEQFQREGRTILFVTHALDLVERVCTRGIVLDHGRVVWDGDPAFAAGTLRGILHPDFGLRPEPERPGLELADLVIAARPGGPPRTEFRPGEPMALQVEVVVNEPDEAGPADLVLVVMGAGDLPMWVMRTPSGAGVPAEPGRYRYDFEVPRVPPVSGGFVVAAALNRRASGEGLTVRRFPQYLTITGHQHGGLLDVSYSCTAAEAPAPKLGGSAG